jgi:hypothetical protein
LPLAGTNPAKWFYDWIDIGTPISIRGHWPVAAPRVEKPTLFGHLSIQKTIIATAAIIACLLIILFILQRRGKV